MVDIYYFFVIKKNTSRKVLKENGPKRVIMVEKALAYNILSLTTISIPIHLTMEENRKDLTVRSLSHKNQHLFLYLTQLTDRENIRKRK